MNFREVVFNTTVETTTTNGMKAIESSLNKNVDLFFKIGASRGKDITQTFHMALQENMETAMRILLWARDVRGGAGERQLFRQVLGFLEKNYLPLICTEEFIAKVVELGRWDDLLVIRDPQLKHLAYTHIEEALDAGSSLCAKWMPRKGAQAADIRTFLGMSPKAYRKRLVELSKVVETQMCAKEWDGINFSHVPSLAMARYTKAFVKNAPEQFGAYKDSLKKEDGTAKINVGAIYPYDVVKTVQHGDVELADLQWAALPNYMGDANILPMVDVSGSMAVPVGGQAYGKGPTCLDMALSLGLYCSDKNTGPFKDLFLTFSSRPKLITLTGTLSQKMQQMNRSDWGMNTNLSAAFDEILRVAITNNVSFDGMPDTVLILSDMQFDACAANWWNESAIEMISRKYQDAGCKMPGVVFWNLNSHDNMPVRFDEKGTALVSGFSPSILKAILACNPDEMSPVKIMENAIGSDRYNIWSN